MSVVRKHDDIIASNLDGSVIMMSIENGKYYGLDTTGSSIWSLLQNPIRITDLIDSLLEQFDVDRETCSRDVLTFLEGLKNDGLLQVDAHP